MSISWKYFCSLFLNSKKGSILKNSQKGAYDGALDEASLQNIYFLNISDIERIEKYEEIFVFVKCELSSPASLKLQTLQLFDKKI